MQVVKGNLEAFSEAGIEFTDWCLYDVEGRGYSSLHSLEKGDYLVVYKKSESRKKREIYWGGKINPVTNKQIVEKYRVHWLQKDVSPYFWEEMFYKEMDAELWRKTKD